jgi:hypothetical protein
MAREEDCLGSKVPRRGKVHRGVVFCAAKEVNPYQTSLIGASSPVIPLFLIVMRSLERVTSLEVSCDSLAQGSHMFRRHGTEPACFPSLTPLDGCCEPWKRSWRVAHRTGVSRLLKTCIRERITNEQQDNASNWLTNS